MPEPLDNTHELNQPPVAANGWEQARLANLMHFASLTPAQRMEWLGWAFELYLLGQKNREAAARSKQ